MKAMKLFQLAAMANAEIKKGNGDKIVAVSDDEECNGYHELYSGFCDVIDGDGENLFDDTLTSRFIKAESEKYIVLC